MEHSEILRFLFDVTVGENRAIITIGTDDLLICKCCKHPMIPKRVRDGYASCVGINELETAKSFGIYEEGAMNDGCCWVCVNNRMNAKVSVLI